MTDFLFQRACVQFVINAKPRQRFMPEDEKTISFKIWLLVESQQFEIVIMVFIALNAIVLMMSVSFTFLFNFLFTSNVLGRCVHRVT